MSTPGPGRLTDASRPEPDHDEAAHFQLLSDEAWLRIRDTLPCPSRRKGRPFADARTMVEAIVYRYRAGIAWRELPTAFGPWQTVWTWHRRLIDDGTWTTVRSAIDDRSTTDVTLRSDPDLAAAHRSAREIIRCENGGISFRNDNDSATN